MNMLGYISIYFKIELTAPSGEEQITVTMWEGDFREPINQSVFDGLASAYKKFYKENGYDVTNITAITREEYQKYLSALEKLGSDSTSISW